MRNQSDGAEEPIPMPIVLHIHLSDDGGATPTRMEFEGVKPSKPITSFEEGYDRVVLALIGLHLHREQETPSVCFENAPGPFRGHSSSFNSFLESPFGKDGVPTCGLFGFSTLDTPETTETPPEMISFWKNARLPELKRRKFRSDRPWSAVLIQSQKCLQLIVDPERFSMKFWVCNTGAKRPMTDQELSTIYSADCRILEVKAITTSKVNVPASKTLWGIDISSDAWRVFVRDLNGNRIPGIAKEREFGSSENRNQLRLEETLRKAYVELKQMAKSDASPSAIGLSVCGPYDIHKDQLVATHAMPPWHSSDNKMSSRSGPAAILKSFEPDVPVAVRNDADAGAITEWYWGEYKRASSILYLFISTGVGAGLVLNGELHHGKNGFAGEVGRIKLSAHGPPGYGEHGTAEGFLSRSGITKLAREEVDRLKQQPIDRSQSTLLSLGESLDEIAVLDAAISGDKSAKRVAQIVGERLGQLIAGHINLLDPEVILIDGLLREKWDAIRSDVHSMIRRHTIGKQKPKDCVKLATCWEPNNISRSIGAARLAYDKSNREQSSADLVHAHDET